MSFIPNDKNMLSLETTPIDPHMGMRKISTHWEKPWGKIYDSSANCHLNTMLEKHDRTTITINNKQ